MRKAAEEGAEMLDPPLMRSTHYWPEPPYIDVYKAGALPYRVTQAGKIEYYLFKPSAMFDDDSDPGFQICKGTREIFNAETDEWENYHKRAQLDELGVGNLEPIKVTAIREAIEEVGLKPEAMIAAGEWGQAAFTSASTGALKTMWLFAIQLEENAEFDEPHATEANTIAREWFNLENEEQSTKIRQDHLQIIRQIDKVLQQALAEA